MLHLQPARVAAQLHERALLAAGLAVHDSVVDVSLLQPATHRLLRDTEVDSDLGPAQAARRAARTTSRLELGGNFPGTLTSFLQNLVPQMECQPTLQQSRRRKETQHRPRGASLYVVTMYSALRDRIGRVDARNRLHRLRPLKLESPPRAHDGLFEVDQWAISEIVLRKIVPAVGIRPFPLNELMLMTSVIAWVRPSHVFEWGTNVGKSARVFHEASRAVRLKTAIHSVDLPDDVDHGEHPRSSRGVLVRGLTNVHLHQGDGVETSLRILAEERPTRPLFFIDGDHSYESVRRELTAVLDAAPGASVLLHDTFWQVPAAGYNVGPADALQEVLAERPDYTTFTPDLGLPGMTLVCERLSLRRDADGPSRG